MLMCPAAASHMRRHPQDVPIIFAHCVSEHVLPNEPCSKPKWFVATSIMANVAPPRRLALYNLFKYQTAVLWPADATCFFNCWRDPVSFPTQLVLPSSNKIKESDKSFKEIRCICSGSIWRASCWDRWSNVLSIGYCSWWLSLSNYLFKVVTI